jgi:hypothetical protein
MPFSESATRSGFQISFKRESASFIGKATYVFNDHGRYFAV